MRSKTVSISLTLLCSALFVHHTDADREYAYDLKSHVGTLDKALDKAAANGWIIVDMKKDWKQIFPKKQP
jgi:hypothetical protein